jgi:hypothetical protein
MTHLARDYERGVTACPCTLGCSSSGSSCSADVCYVGCTQRFGRHALDDTDDHERNDVSSSYHSTSARTSAMVELIGKALGLAAIWGLGAVAACKLERAATPHLKLEPAHDCMPRFSALSATLAAYPNCTTAKRRNLLSTFTFLHKPRPRCERIYWAVRHRLRNSMFNVPPHGLLLQ